jgi:serpin B
MRKGIRAGLAMLAMTVVAGGCASASTTAVPPGPVARGVATVEPTANPRPLATADTAFGLDVLRQWCAQYPRRNLVFSPSTLATALGMAYLGARGTTAQVMAGVLHLPAVGGQTLAAELQARTKALSSLQSPGVTLAASDNVWADPTLPILRNYLNAVATGYDAGVTQAPFSTNAQQAADEINNSVAHATRGHITQLVTPQMLASIGWVLTSALYMDAVWATPFSPDATKPGPFTLTGGGQVTAKYLNGPGFRVATAGGWQAVSLPYKGGKLTMTALLPPTGAGSCALPGQAALATISAALSGSAGGSAGGSDTADVSLPKVNLDTQGSVGDMAPVLKALGMGQAFSSGADFSALSSRACCIGFVQQAATLQVGEKGTVAAAAAAVGMTPTMAIAAPPRTIAFNRPYLMLVTATATGEPLFLAKVANPTAS